ncbi:MAG TPA: efflux RND transporter periplasmic adaptor subunit [Thermoanaerobaculia bacterium]|nr:efflux RND transporter periplasmic adaptor subunit [Thermoanaerobaculia bacterium]
MEAHMVSFFDRQRYVVPTLVVLALIAAISTGIYLSTKKKKPEDKTASAVATGAAGGAAKKGKDAGKEKEKTPVPVSVQPVTLATISSYISSTANLVAENEVKIIAEAEGRVARLMVEEGAMVSQGQPVAALARDDAEIALTKAKVRNQNAQLAHNRASDMLGKGLLSQSDHDKTFLEKRVAEQELAEAQWRLGKTLIRSPFGGKVTDRMISQGQHVRIGDPLFTITDFDPLIARIYLPERDVVALTQGREVRIRLKADEATTFAGRIRQISPVVDTATGTVKVTIEAVKPPAGVRPGAFVTVDVVRETRPKALLLPREAVIRELRDAHVFIVKGDVAERRAVSLGIEEGDFIEVTSGLQAGDQVIVAGQGGLKDGSLIKVQPKTVAAILEF